MNFLQIAQDFFNHLDALQKAVVIVEAAALVMIVVACLEMALSPKVK